MRKVEYKYKFDASCGCAYDNMLCRFGFRIKNVQHAPVPGRVIESDVTVN